MYLTDCGFCSDDQGNESSQMIETKMEEVLKMPCRQGFDKIFSLHHIDSVQTIAEPIRY